MFDHDVDDSIIEISHKKIVLYTPRKNGNFQIVLNKQISLL